MKTTFGAITQPHIRTMLENNNARVLALLMFYEIRKNPEKVFKVSSCIIYRIISNYVCIIYLACKSKKLSEPPVSFGGGFKHGNKSYKKIGNWNSIFVNELDVLSWIFEEHKSYFHIKIS